MIFAKYISIANMYIPAATPYFPLGLASFCSGRIYFDLIQKIFSKFTSFWDSTNLFFHSSTNT